MQLDDLDMDTGRLSLRHFRAGDEAACFAWLSDERTCLDAGGFHAFDEMDEEFRCMMKWYAGEPGRYMLERVGDERVIGTVVVTQSEERAVPAVEIGYQIAPPYRRRGYASEAVAAVCAACFERGAELVLAGAYAYNRASIRMLEKLGFQCEGTCRMEENHAELGFVDMTHFVLVAPQRERKKQPRMNGMEAR